MCSLAQTIEIDFRNLKIKVLSIIDRIIHCLQIQQVRTPHVTLAMIPSSQFHLTAVLLFLCGAAANWVIQHNFPSPNFQRGGQK